MPRARGDDTPALTISVLALFYAPLTRGWHVQKVRQYLRTTLCLAHAGMTRRANLLTNILTVTPRARGDDTGPRRMAAHAAGYAPLTRGWHDTPRQGQPANSLCPAHAGMTRSRVG